MSTNDNKKLIVLGDAEDLINKFSMKNRTIRWGVTKYMDEFPALLIEFMIQEKGTLTAFCALVGCSISTMNNWMERHVELKEAYEVAKGYRSWSYEKLLHDCAGGTIKGNFSAIKFGLMNYNGDDFKEKQEIEHTGNVTFSIDSGIARPGDAGYEDIESVEFAEVVEDTPDQKAERRRKL